ncbi:hypothetical protein [Dyadobacter pollutisoli]|uniref:Na+-driven multidrug efflux pump n=1 Tax=Dyadobacter pollutisoli TaxID=2910158 RepID=A0A9E8NDC3_9BACT|nr:hypothetical protein [Dyadobacter pollutisoli]WAC13228.1 hypothetical protein ON006_04535 [Dyadobacter pollutisoli]
MKASNKVILNTGILYGRMLLTVGISLFATRLVLNALGSTDFGIFNLIAGIIVMLSFLNAAMATSTQRYLSYYQGKKDFVMQQKVFTNSLLLHVVIGTVIVLSLEIAGVYLFDGFLNIANDRVDAAQTVYHFMSVTVFFTIISVPFTGSLIAHENMFWVALVNIVEALLRLLIAFLLYKLSGDKLVIYGILTASLSVVSLLMYAIYCFKSYKDCTLEGLFKINTRLIKELSSFAGWNLFGAVCSLGRTQGLAIILNLFLGTVVNAAYGIASQVSSQLNFFSATLLRTINPQIMKSEGAGDRDRMLRLSMIASKYGFILLALIGIPCIFEMNNILVFWLKDPPKQSSTFCQLILLGTLFNQLTVGLQSAIQARGNIKLYQVLVGTLLILNLPIAYYLLYLGKPAFWVLASYCSMEAIACICRLLFANKLLGLKLMTYIKHVIYPQLLPSLISCIICLGSLWLLKFDFRFIVTGILSAIGFILSLILFGFDKSEVAIFNKLFDKVRSLTSFTTSRSV